MIRIDFHSRGVSPGSYSTQAIYDMIEALELHIENHLRPQLNRHADVRSNRGVQRRIDRYEDDVVRLSQLVSTAVAGDQPIFPPGQRGLCRFCAFELVADDEVYIHGGLVCHKCFPIVSGNATRCSVDDCNEPSFEGLTTCALHRFHDPTFANPTYSGEEAAFTP